MAGKAYIGWNRIEDFGKEYYSLVQAGIGLSPETRSRRQIELANMIISNSRDYVYKLAHKLIFHGGYKVFNTVLSLGYERQRISHDLLVEKEMTIYDLANAAVIGIIESMDNYDPNKGKLRNFIRYNAIASMITEAREKLGLVRLPKLMHGKAIKLNRAYSYSGLIKALSEEFGSIYSAQLAHLGITGEYYSLHEANTQGSNMYNRRNRLEDRIKDPDAILLEDEIANKEALCHTQQALHCLSPIEQKIIAMRLGFDDTEGKTLREIGDELGFCRERIRQIESNAFKKIQKILSEQKAL